MIENFPEWSRCFWAEHGLQIVNPGERPYFTTAEWHPDSHLGVKDGCVFVLLVRAEVQGIGSFRRLVDAIVASGDEVTVVAPLPQLEAILRRWRWSIDTGAGVEFWFPGEASEHQRSPSGIVRGLPGDREKRRGRSRGPAQVGRR